MELTTKAYRQGEGSITNVLEAQRKLLDVRLELAKTKKERIDLLKEQVNIAKKAWDVAENRFKAATVPKTDVLAARAAYLDAQIRLAREEPKVGWGHLKGRFVFDGEPPKAKPLTITKDVEYFGNFKLVDESLVVGKGKGLANVLVYVRNPTRVHESYAESAQRNVTLRVAKGRFEPRVLLMQRGQTLLIENLEAVAVNVRYSFLFNVVLRAGKTQRVAVRGSQPQPDTFTNAIHPWFVAYGIVLDHPYAAVSGKDGTFEIRNLPVGEMEFQLWHERSKELKVKPADEKGRMKVTIKPGTTDLGTIKIPPSVLGIK